MKTLIGLTGGIGSGKSEVCRIFSMLGTAIYKADEASKYLLDSNELLRQKLSEAFGSSLYENGKINRKALSMIIFRDASSISLANSIIHPYVFEDFEKWVINQAENTYLLMETAILFESLGNKRMDKIITVYSASDIRIERVIKRDKCTREDVLARMKFQMPDEDKLKLSDFIIYNDEKHMLIPQVVKLHEQFRNELE